MTGIFGSFLTDWQVEQAVISHLRAWMPDYLPHARRIGEAIREEPFSDFPQPRSYSVTPREPDRWPEEQLPAFLIVSTGMIDPPRRDSAGNGEFRGKFSIGVGAICSAGEEEMSKLLAGLYFTAAAQILLDKPSLGGFAEGTTFQEPPQNDWLESDRDRTLAARFAVFAVEVKGILEITGGPAEHLDDPTEDPGNVPTVLTTDLELEKQP